MRLRHSATAAFLIALGGTTAWAQDQCRERAFAGIGIAQISALSDNRVLGGPVAEPARSPTILLEGTARIACRVGVGFETMSLGTVASGIDQYASTLAQSQTESERLWLITGRVRLIGSRFVALDGLVGVGGLDQSLDTTNISYNLDRQATRSSQETHATTLASTYGAELAFRPVHHLEIVGGLRVLRATRDVAVDNNVTPVDLHMWHSMVTLSARAAW